MDPQFRDGAVDERSEAEDEGSNTGQCEDAVASILCLKHHHYDSGEQKGDRRVPDREKVQAKETEENEKCAQRAGHDGTRDVELEVDEKAAKDE
jgi:hypothetical protein